MKNPLLDLETVKDELGDLLTVVYATEDAIEYSPNVAEDYTPALRIVAKLIAPIRSSLERLSTNFVTRKKV